MSAQPGWYDAGVPGQQRWWDGAQWTAHERAAAAPVAPAIQAAPMGWYPVPGKTDVRWWDGAGWAPYRMRDGRPKGDAFAIEPANTGLILGILFIVLGVLQSAAYSLSGDLFFVAAPMLFVVTGVVAIAGGAHSSAVRKLPTPQTAPVFDPSTRPLPGEVEGDGAGWYPVAGQVGRWWTGTRWSWYVAQKFGVRPGQEGPLGYRISMMAGWACAGIGALGVVFGILMAAALDVFAGVLIVIVAGILVLGGGLVLLVVYLRRYALILPEKAPPLR